MFRLYLGNSGPTLLFDGAPFDRLEVANFNRTGENEDKYIVSYAQPTQIENRERDVNKRVAVFGRYINRGNNNNQTSTE